MKARSLVAVALFALVALMLAPLAHADPVIDIGLPSNMYQLNSTITITAFLGTSPGYLFIGEQSASIHLTDALDSPYAATGVSALAGTTPCSGRLATIHRVSGGTPSLQ